MWMKIL